MNDYIKRDNAMRIAIWLGKLQDKYAISYIKKCVMLIPSIDAAEHCKDCKDYSHKYNLCHRKERECIFKPRKTMDNHIINADVIRNMSNDELALFIRNIYLAGKNNDGFKMFDYNLELWLDSEVKN